MVVFVDLEADEDESSYPAHDTLKVAHYLDRYHHRLGLHTGDETLPRGIDSGHSFSAALTCYPVALSLSSHLDLNDLHSLSLTCRRIHDSLSQYSRQLVSNSLRCDLDNQPLLSEILAAQRAENEPNPSSGTAAIPLHQVQLGFPWSDIHLGSGSGTVCSKIGACARDLVAECRNCGTVVCRNCLAKPPSRYYIRDRHRRLCKKCIEAPLSAHLQPLSKSLDTCDSPPRSSASSTRSARSISGSSLTDSAQEEASHLQAFTSAAFLRDMCTCDSRGLYLCGPCGQNLRANDVTYRRVWTWRSRYSTHIGGGLGTGLGTGNQGQKCGRGEHCLETGPSCVSWVEIDCSEGSGSEHGQDHEFLSGSRAGTPVGEGSMSNKPGYLQQEIEGIGGVVKKKVKKRVKVGATVWEYEDERKTGRYLEREASGKERSWCGWCGRVCLGESDRQAPDQKDLGQDRDRDQDQDQEGHRQRRQKQG